MTLSDVFNVCRVRGVRLVIQDGQLRAQGKPGAVTEPLKEGLARHKARIVELLGEGVWFDASVVDETLPNEIIIPAGTPNNERVIKLWIDAQRIGRAA